MLGFDLGILPNRKVRHIAQTELAECGLACIAMVSHYHGKEIDLSVLRQEFRTSSRGLSLASMIRIANDLDFQTRALKVSLDDLRRVPKPVILHWNMTHFVVLERIRRGRALVHNPATASRWLTLAELSDHYTGVILELEPSSSFTRVDERRRVSLKQLWTSIRGVKRALLQVVLLSCVTQSFVLSTPYFLQLAVDSALPSLDHALLNTLAFGFMVFAIIAGAALLLRASVIIAAGSSFSYGLTSNLGRRLFRLPIEWYERRHVGDVLSRFQSVGPIRSLITEDAAASMMDGAFALITLLLMAMYSGKLALIALVTVGIYLLIRLMLFPKLRSAQDRAYIAAGREQSILIETLRGIRALRLADREDARHSFWQGKLVASINATVEHQRISAWQSTAHNIVYSLEGILSIWIAVSLVMNGGFSLGMLFAYIAYKTLFLNSTGALVDKAMDLKMVGLHLDRLADIAMTNPDVSFQTKVSDTGVPIGGVEVRNVSYRYSDDESLVLDGLSFSIEPGEFLAITGPSGGGKSTLLQIILGLIEPLAGDVLVDGVSLKRYGHKNFFRKLGAVLQDDSLFAGTIADNITLFDEDRDWERMRWAAEASVIEADITKMSMGFDTLIGDMGSALSGGQRQRLLLARALYRRPSFLVIDEGTSHLDLERERKVNHTLSSLGITRLVVAHRPETLNMADRVLYLRNGKLFPAP